MSRKPSPDKIRARVAAIVERLPEGKAVQIGDHMSLEVRKRRFGTSSGTPKDAVTLTPIFSPDRNVVVTSTGEVTLASDHDRSASGQQSRFVKRAGLADKAGVSFTPVSMPDRYLRHVDGTLRLGSMSSAADRASATFMMD